MKNDRNPEWRCCSGFFYAIWVTRFPLHVYLKNVRTKTNIHKAFPKQACIG